MRSDLVLANLIGNRELGLSPKQGREFLTTDLNDFHRFFTK